MLGRELVRQGHSFFERLDLDKPAVAVEDLLDEVPPRQLRLLPRDFLLHRFEQFARGGH